MKANNPQRVVITGFGCITPIGHNIEETWSNIISGVCGAKEITQFDTTSLNVNFACEVKEFNPEDHFDRKQIRRMDRFVQLGLIATKEAIEKSKLNIEKINLAKVGTHIGSGMGGLKSIEDTNKVALSKPNRVSPFYIPSSIANMLSGHVSIKYGFQGPNLCNVTACSSSTHAIGESARIIERGDANVMITGGSEATITVTAVSGFANMKALSKNPNPQAASRPFDLNRDGFVIGEGSAILVLESLEHALARNAPIYGEIIGYARNSDAFHETNPSPNGRGASECMKLCLEDAEIDVSEVDHINTHGTSTPAGDKAEAEAINSLFGELSSNKILSTSTKSMTGHLLGATGAMEAIFSTLAINNNICPPTINLENQDPECKLNLSNKSREKNINIALTNNFGFGGTNASLIIKQFTK